MVPVLMKYFLNFCRSPKKLCSPFDLASVILGLLPKTEHRLYSAFSKSFVVKPVTGHKQSLQQVSVVDRIYSIVRKFSTKFSE